MKKDNSYFELTELEVIKVLMLRTNVTKSEIYKAIGINPSAGSYIFSGRMRGYNDSIIEFLIEQADLKGIYIDNVRHYGKMFYTNLCPIEQSRILRGRLGMSAVEFAAATTVNIVGVEAGNVSAESEEALLDYLMEYKETGTINFCEA